MPTPRCPTADVAASGILRRLHRLRTSCRSGERNRLLVELLEALAHETLAPRIERTRHYAQLNTDMPGRGTDFLHGASAPLFAAVSLYRQARGRGLGIVRISVGTRVRTWSTAAEAIAEVWQFTLNAVRDTEIERALNAAFRIMTPDPQSEPIWKGIEPSQLLLTTASALGVGYWTEGINSLRDGHDIVRLANRLRDDPMWKESLAQIASQSGDARMFDPLARALETDLDALSAEWHLECAAAHDSTGGEKRVTLRVATAGGEGDAPTDDDTEPLMWDELGEAKQAILTVLARAADPMQNPAVAQKAGYKPGTLRHHYGELQNWQLVELTKDGYKLTPTGRAIIPPGQV